MVFIGKVLECVTVHCKKCFPSCQRQIHVRNGYPGIHIKLISAGWKQWNKQTQNKFEGCPYLTLLKTSPLHTSPHIHTLLSYFSVLASAEEKLMFCTLGRRCRWSWGDRIYSQQRVSGLRSCWGCNSADTWQWPADSGHALRSLEQRGSWQSTCGVTTLQTTLLQIPSPPPTLGRS